jgi:hypothetical protein
MPARPDAIDQACEEWARVIRELYGITDPRLSSGFLGPVRCTLAARRDLHHGGRSGRVEQQWPAFPFENASPRAQVVHRASQRMSEPLRTILVAHYVPLVPRSRAVRAELLGLGRRVYFERVARVKAFIEGALAAS